MPRKAWSAALNDPVDTAATTGTGVTDSEMPSGAARFVACSLGALAGRKALLLPCVTLASDGSAFGIAAAAAIQNNQDYPAELDGELTDSPENVISVHAPRIAAPAVEHYRILSPFSGSHGQRPAPVDRLRVPAEREAVPDRRFATGGGDYRGTMWRKMPDRRRVTCGM